MRRACGRQLGLADGLELQLNRLGTPEARAAYREHWSPISEAHHDQLDEDSQRRLHSNPLRILDSKTPQMQAICSRPRQALMSRLGEGSQDHLDRVRASWTRRVWPIVNPRLVRGLDYYR